uniref:Cysteine proteinase inhibitor n=1 Tax=Oryza brachyantha TaxID=4533 RepID=J3LLA2_ORYBR
MRTSSLLFAAVAIAIAVAAIFAAAAAADTELGRWAVAATGLPGLTFDRVTDGEKQVVAGVSYRLTLEASSSGAKDGRYEAVVYEQAGGSNSRKLVSFEPIH